MSDEFRAIPDLVVQHARTAPDRVALVCDGARWTYAELQRHMDAVAAQLQQDGCAPGASVCICAAASLAYVAAFLGALRAGACVAPLPPSATPERLAAMVRDTGARWLFVDGAGAAALQGRTPARLLRLGEDLAVNGTPRPVEIGPDLPFNIIYSSGTTGTPKGIVQSHARRWQHTRSLAALGAGADSVAMVATPLYSNTTLVVLFPMLALGGTTVLMPKFDAAGYLRLAKQHRASHTLLVPVQYQRILDAPTFATHDLSSFRMKMVTGAPCAPQLKAEILARWPGALVEFYGSTEGAGGCALRADQFPHKLHTVGRPVPGSEIRIIDEAGRELPPGEAGEVVGHSAVMMAGYHGLAQATSEAEWRDASGRRFLRTGDVGYFDEDGFLVLVDRKKDMIISGGFNVYPADLEAVLCRHADVAEAAVVGAASRRWGETPVAYVVPRAGRAVEAEALREWANAQLGKTQRIARVTLVDALPRNALGKLLKRELRQVAQAMP